jgi:hypothetical protein
VGSVGDAANHAGGLYGTAGRKLRHPVRSVDGEAQHLHRVALIDDGDDV